MPPETVSVRPVEESDRDWLRETLTQLGQLRILSRGRLTEDASQLPGLLAEREGAKVGLVLVRIDDGELEVVALQALTRREGIGTTLLAAAADEARRARCSRAWLITTNDNLDAVRFYQRRGWELIALHRDAITAGRHLKPEIPEIGDYKLPIRHELEFELRVCQLDITHVIVQQHLSRGLD